MKLGKNKMGLRNSLVLQRNDMLKKKKGIEREIKRLKVKDKNAAEK